VCVFFSGSWSSLYNLLSCFCSMRIWFCRWGGPIVLG
jgi:hypothetical protein